MRRAVDEGYVLVTNDAADFRRLVGREEIHAGLVCLNVALEVMSLPVQRRLFGFTLDQLRQDEPVNESWKSP